MQTTYHAADLTSTHAASSQHLFSCAPRKAAAHALSVPQHAPGLQLVLPRPAGHAPLPWFAGQQCMAAARALHTPSMCSQMQQHTPPACAAGRQGRQLARRSHNQTRAPAMWPASCSDCLHGFRVHAPATCSAMRSGPLLLESMDRTALWIAAPTFAVKLEVLGTWRDCMCFMHCGSSTAEAAREMDAWASARGMTCRGASQGAQQAQHSGRAHKGESTAVGITTRTTTGTTASTAQWAHCGSHYGARAGVHSAASLA